MRIGANRVSVYLFLLSLLFVAAALPAASYLPLSDTDLARRAPLIVRAQTVSTEVKLKTMSGQPLPMTVVTFDALETLKGTAPPSRFQIVLPGGRIGDQAWTVPGTPVFHAGDETVLFLEPPSGPGAAYRLTEFGLSRFDIRMDKAGRRFAVRPAFSPAEDDRLSGRRTVESATLDRPLRDAASFLSSLPTIAEGRAAAIEYAWPSGGLTERAKTNPLFVNIGGPENGSNNLFRFFWDTGASPSIVVSTAGSQTNLSDSSNGVTHVQNAVDQWHGVAGTDIRYSGVAAGGNLTVNLDATSSFDGGSAWNTALPCGTGGVIGLGGPGDAFGPRTFKGDGNYFAPRSGTISMRQRTGSAGCYSAAVFRSAVLHEMGHTLGLGHPDKKSDGTDRTQADESTHSTTTPEDWAAAVMAAAIHPPFPATPQTDDLQGILFYYGTGVAATCVADSQTLCLNSGRFRVRATWSVPTQGTSGIGMAVPLTSDTGYFWFFNSANVELVIKVLDGRGVNGKFWVFKGALSDVQYTITVTDMQTAAVKVYTNQQGNLASFADVSAFSPATGSASIGGEKRDPVDPTPIDSESSRSAIVGAKEAFLSEMRQALQTIPSPAASPAFEACSGNATTLCLNQSRFTVRVSWSVPTQGTSGTGNAVALTSDTGYFWFFNSANVELVIKVLDGRGVNGHFWVLYGALSDVRYTITVTDTQTGAVMVYNNDQGNLASVADVGAF